MLLAFSELLSKQFSAGLRSWDRTNADTGACEKCVLNIVIDRTATRIKLTCKEFPHETNHFLLLETNSSSIDFPNRLYSGLKLDDYDDN